MQKTTIAIEGMTCSHCVNAVTQALEGLDGVSTVKVSLEDNNAVVEYDEAAVTLEAIKAAIVEEGYKV